MVGQVDVWWAKLTCGGLIQAPSRHDGLCERQARYKAIMINHDHNRLHALCHTPDHGCDHAVGMITLGCHDHE